MIYKRKHIIYHTTEFPYNYNAEDMWYCFCDSVKMYQECYDKIPTRGLIKTILTKIDNKTFKRETIWKSKKHWDRYALIKPMHCQHEDWFYDFEDNLTDPNIHPLIRLNFKMPIKKIKKYLDKFQFKEYDQKRGNYKHNHIINSKNFLCTYDVEDALDPLLIDIQNNLKINTKLKGVFQKTLPGGYLDWHIDPISSWSINVVLKGEEKGIMFNDYDSMNYKTAIINTQVLHKPQPMDDNTTRIVFKMYGDGSYNEIASSLKRWW